MILTTRFINLKIILILVFLLLVPSCAIHYPWVQGRLPLKARFINSLNLTCLIFFSSRSIVHGLLTWLISNVNVLETFICPLFILMIFFALNMSSVDRAHYKSNRLDYIELVISDCS